MKKLIQFFILFCLLHPFTSQAIEFKITGPCSVKPLFMNNQTIQLPDNLGALTLQILQKNQIPYIGSQAGINSIYATPIGLDAIEVVNDEELRAYGWCFAIDNQVPDLMPDQIKITDQFTKIHWFYAYSTSIRNEWVDYCVPAYQVKSPQFCKNTNKTSSTPTAGTY